MVKTAKAAQEFVPIKEIRDGIVIMKNGHLRMILMASSLNFALKSEDEQKAIISRYQSFLNSLDFSIQIFIQSRGIDIAPYLNSLKEAEKKQTNELLEIQTKEYIEFIKNFVQSTNIVSKTFYLVVPYSPPIKIAAKEGLGGIMEKVGLRKKQEKQENQDEAFEEHKLQLQQRADAVSGSLSSIGVRLAPLNTEELIELFYQLFNPGELEKGTPGLGFRI